MASVAKYVTGHEKTRNQSLLFAFSFGEYFLLPIISSNTKYTESQKKRPQYIR